MASLEDSRVLAGQPGADYHLSAWTQHAMRLCKKPLFILHVFRALDGENDVERSRWQVVFQPVAQEVVRIASTACFEKWLVGTEWAKSLVPKPLRRIPRQEVEL